MSVTESDTRSPPPDDRPFEEWGDGPAPYAPGEAPRSPGDRTPPQDMAAEQSVIGSMLISKDAIASVSEVLRGPDFYRPAHETIHDAIIDLFSRGEPVDMVTVAAELNRRGELQRIGGAPYLHTLAANVPIAANAEFYAQIVRECAILRRLVDAGTKIAQLGYAGEGQVDDIVDRAQAEVYQITDRRTAEDYAPLSDIMDKVLDEIEAIGNREAGLYGVPTGFAELDDLTNGLHAGQMIIVAGRPAMGKIDARPRLLPGGVGGQQPDQRLLQPGDDQVGDHDAAALGRGQGAAQPHPQRPDGQHRLGQDGPPHGQDLRGADVHRRLAQHDHDGDPGQGPPAQAAPRPELIIIDYMQLMTSGRKVESRQLEVSEFSRQIKLLAKELEVPIIALSQLNRGPEQRGDKRPMMSDLRESGSLEQDADMVILLHRDDVYEKESTRPGEADLIVAKHRNGATRDITVAFQGHYSRFVDMAH